MNRIIQQLQQYALVRSVLYLLAGVSVILFPQQFTSGVIYLIAGYIGFWGLVNLFSAFRLKRSTGYYGFEMIFGIILIIAALATLALAKPLLTLLTVFLGVLIVANGCLRIYQAFNLKSFNQAYIGWIIYGGLLIIGGGILMFNAIGSIMFLFGCLLILMSLSELIGYFQFKRKII